MPAVNYLGGFNYMMSAETDSAELEIDNGSSKSDVSNSQGNKSDNSGKSESAKGDKSHKSKGGKCYQMSRDGPTYDELRRQHRAEQKEGETPKCRSAWKMPKLMLKIRPQKGERGQTFEAEAIADTGCGRMSCGPKVPEMYGYKIKNYEYTPLTTYTASGEPMKHLGQINCQVTANGKTIAMPIHVVEGLGKKVFISFRDLMDFGALSRNFPERFDASSSEDEGEEENQLMLQTTTVNKNNNNDTPVPKEKTKLESRLERLNKKYKLTVFSGEIKSIVGEPQKLIVNEELMKEKPPKKCMSARNCPRYLQPGAAEQIKKMLKDKVIRIIPIDEVTPFVCPTGFTPKRTPGKVRVYSDLKEVNKYLVRSPHPLPKLQELIQDVPPSAGFFATFDLADGFYQVELAAESQKFTCCICPQLGDIPAFKYVYEKAPQGLKTSSDTFCERTDKALAGLDGFKKYVDDCLVFAESEDEIFERIEQLYKACEKANIGLNEAKCVIGEEVAFAGMVINKSGHKPDPKRMEAIREAKPPKDLTSLRSFIGLVNTLLTYRSDISQLLRPLHKLTKKNSDFIWTGEAQHAFERCKFEICNGPEMIVEPFDPKYDLEIHCDASLQGLGFHIMGVDSDGGSHLIQCGSRSLSDPETRYEMVSLELLAVSFAADKAKYILLGAPKQVTVVTDCKALIGLFGKDLNEISNNRLLRLRQKLMPYNLKFRHVAGAKNCAADYMSRNPVGKPSAEDEEFAKELTLAMTNPHLSFRVSTDANMEVLAVAAENDKAYQRVRQAVIDNENFNDLAKNHPARKYKREWEHMSVEEDFIVVDNNRILVPSKARAHVLDLLHRSHAGIIRTVRLARRYYTWPGMKRDIEEMINTCEECQQRRDAQPEEPLRRQFPCDRPCDLFSIDLMAHKGTDYLVGVDRWSFFPMVEKMRGTASSNIIAVLERWWGE